MADSAQQDQRQSSVTMSCDDDSLELDALGTVRRLYSHPDSTWYTLERLRSLGLGQADVLGLGDGDDSHARQHFWKAPLCVPGRLVPVYTGVVSGEPLPRPMGGLLFEQNSSVDQLSCQEQEQTQPIRAQHGEANTTTPSPDSSISDSGGNGDHLEGGGETVSPGTQNDARTAHSTTRDTHDTTSLSSTPDKPQMGSSSGDSTTNGNNPKKGDRRMTFGEVLARSLQPLRERSALGRAASTPNAMKGPERSRSQSEPPNDGTMHKASQSNDMRLSVKIDKLRTLLAQPTVDMEALRQLCWSGIPHQARATAWKLLSGYLPAKLSRRQSTLERKREEYQGLVSRHFDGNTQGRNAALHHQISIDLPRTNPTSPLFQHPAVRQALYQILYIWATRRPASGYVQGLNDLVTPFYIVFLADSVEGQVDELDIDTISPVLLAQVEADSFWCLCKLLDSIQDYYTSSQPGIQRNVLQLEELIKRVDVTLYQHLKNHDVDFLHFAFRWMNCLLMRELPMDCTIRLWDTYMAEPNGFAELHLYVCAAFLFYWSPVLLGLSDFSSIITFLQNLPTQNWSANEIELIVARAYLWKSMFQNSPNHLGR